MKRLFASIFLMLVASAAGAVKLSELPSGQDLGLASNGCTKWSSTTTGGAANDTSICRLGAASIQVGTGTTGTATGSVTAATFVGALTGNAATATALAANPADCSAGQYATTIAASGALTCAQVAASEVSGLGTLATQNGTFSGTSSGTNTGDQTNITGNAGTVTTADAGGDTTTFPMLATDATGNLSPATDAGLSYNATTNALTATTFVGALTGDVTGNVSGSSGSTTGNAATATALAANGTNCSAGQAAGGVDASGNAEDCTGYASTSAANTFTAAQEVEITDAGTNTVVYPLIVDHQSSGTPANGQGVGIAFDVETAAGNTERLGSISAVSYDVTAASEDSRIRFNAFYAGAEVVAGHIGPHNSIAGYGNLWLGTTAPSSTNHAMTSAASMTAVNATSNVYVGVSGTNYQVFGNAYLYTISTGQFGWTSSGTIGTTADTGLARNAAGVIRASAGASEIRGFLGGGAAVASAAALPVPTGRVFHVTGTTGITSITSTNFGSGACVTMIFDGALTVTDGSNLKLAGDFTTTADDTLSVCYDGTSWFETSRSVN